MSDDDPEFFCLGREDFAKLSMPLRIAILRAGPIAGAGLLARVLDELEAYDAKEQARG